MSTSTRSSVRATLNRPHHSAPEWCLTRRSRSEWDASILIPPRQKFGGKAGMSEFSMFSPLFGRVPKSRCF